MALELPGAHRSTGLVDVLDRVLDKGLVIAGDIKVSLAEVELLAQLPDTMDVAVGLVDVKNTWIEPAELVAERLRTVLKSVAPERVSVTPDCGFSQTARHVARAKARAMVEGVRLVRNGLKR